MNRLSNLNSLSKLFVGKKLNTRYFSSSISTLKDAVGFIGLGNMGGHMAKNLVKNGYSVTVFDVIDDSVNMLVQAGAKKAGSPAEVAESNSTLVTMLPSSPHVKNVYTGDNGILSKVQAGSLLIDSSTIDPFVSKDIEEACKSEGADFMDAPVSGGVNAARDAILSFMVGGNEKRFPETEAVLKNMGKNIVYTGAVGTGEAAKICNNMLLAINMIGTAETMNMGIKLGLDPKMLAKILNISSGRSWCTELYNPCPGVLDGVPSSNNYQGGFGSALMNKDLGLAQDAADSIQTATPLGSLAQQIYNDMCSKGYDKKDFSSAFLYIQELQRRQK